MSFKAFSASGIFLLLILASRAEALPSIASHSCCHFLVCSSCVFAVLSPGFSCKACSQRLVASLKSLSAVASVADFRQACTSSLMKFAASFAFMLFNSKPSFTASSIFPSRRYCLAFAILSSKSFFILALLLIISLLIVALNAPEALPRTTPLLSLTVTVIWIIPVSNAVTLASFDDGLLMEAFPCVTFQS